ncbi:HAD family hydrolase [Streptococcus mutans]|nr:HAD-IIB family hydrolase [Streptococcus mutans]MCB4941155.1 HAD family hydrolase [Streptococcus mutans]MCB5002588.1 HAD family hydrolase [Streptococcus mutans]MCB5013711.1 HAD family hydrolase [Streptococcus mutans]MCB5067770.1 HAD family hydrolase [Streptococcus mutans]
MQFVFDIDGTICFDRFQIDARIKAILKDAANYGHQISFASARSYRDCIDVLGQELSQKTVIGLNGGLAYKAGELILEKPMNHRAFDLALYYCHRYQLPYFVDDDFNYAHHLEQFIPFIHSVDPLKLAKEVVVEDLKHPIKMVVFFGNHLDKIAEVSHHLAKLEQLDITFHDDESCLYLNPKEVTKSSTIQELFDHDFVAFGNDRNDIAMFQAAVYSVQVGDFVDLSPFADTQVLLRQDYHQAVADKIHETFEKFRA